MTVRATIPPRPHREAGVIDSPRTHPTDAAIYEAEDRWEVAMREYSIITTTALPDAEVSLYLTELLKIPAIQQRWPVMCRFGIQVRKRKAKHLIVHVPLQVLTLPKHINLWPVHLILHEVAHCAVQKVDHGSEWIDAYVRLVRHELGRIASDLLRQELTGAAHR